MRTIFRLLAALLLLLSIAACNKNKVNLVETTAKAEVPSLGNLSFTFDKNLVADSLLDKWDSTEYITFDPPIQGRFRWQNANELVFSPEFELAPATDYKATVTKQILKYNKQFSLGKCPEATFHTPYLNLSNTYALWNVSEGSSTNAFPQVDLQFNHNVDPEKVKGLLSIEVDGEQKNFNVQTTAPDSKVSLTLVDVKMEDKDKTVKLKLGKGLSPLRGNSATKEDITAMAVLASPYNVNINNIESNHDGSQGVIKVFMSQTPLTEGLNTFIDIQPKVNFKTEVSAEGMVISSDEFNVSTTYNLTLKKGLKGRIGGTLKEEYTSSIGFGKLAPEISFGNKKGVYLGSKGSKNVEVRITSIEKVKVTISKVYENNLLAAGRYGYSPNTYEYYGGDDEEGEYYDYSDYYGGEASFGDIIYQKEIETKSLPRYGNSRLFTFNIDDKLKDYKGIYHIRIQSTEDYWRREERMISLTDIGLIAKESKDKILVFANSIQTAESMSGVNVSVYGKNNQLIGNATTDASGVAEVAVKNKDFSGFKAAMITAKIGDDFNYMPFNTTRVETSRFDVGGKRKSMVDIDAFIYSERDIYRPGEKINFSVIARNWNWKTPGEIPFKMKFVLPNGKELKTLKKTLNEQGSLETQIELSPSAITGSYTFELYTSNDILIASKAVMIEEFMPDRIKVTASLDKPSLKPNDATTLSVSAVNFFGPPAANRNYEVEMQVKEKSFSPDKYYRYNFFLSDRNSYYDPTTREGSTDENGNAKETFTIPAEYANRGLMQADFYTTVFDETGRPVNRKTSADIFTQDVFYGIGNNDYYYTALNQNVAFPIIALNKDEKPLSGAKAHIQVIKHDYKTVLSNYDSYFRYESQRDDKTLIDQEITVSGEATVFNFIPRTPGNYEIRVGKPGINSYVSSEFYSYGYWGNGSSTFEVNNEGNIDIETDKKNYFTGENVKLLFKTPFNGKMLVTVETDKVVSHQYVKVEKRTASLDINLKAEFLPNAYITATLIKPNAESDMPLTVAHGFKSVSVEDKNRKMDVQITAEKQVRSRTHQKVRVKAAPGSKVTIAAVDEGILSITGYKTPDPYAYFYAKRALEVNSFDLYPLLFPELKGVMSSTGGDGFDLSKRTNPMQNKRVKLISYWSGILDANGSGEVTYEFDVPQFSGQIRIMAVAYKDASFGSNEASMTVADPLVVSTALPRFLSPKDTVIMPVTITNTTKNSTNATATLKIVGPVKAIGGNTQTISLKANSEGRANFKIVADPKIDVAKITVEVSALNEKFVEETDITIRPAASLQKITDAGSIAAGSTKQINIGQNKFIAGSADYQLVVSKNPALELSEQIDYLVRYPYGCTEQTVSAAFPQLYFSDLSELMNIDKSVKTNANYNVQEAIRKIKMRQLYNGGLTLWDGEGTESWWATVYAAHFLYEAKKAGFDVEKGLQDNIYSYLINKLKNKETITYYYNRNQKKVIAPKEVAYSLYVLALAGKPQVSTMNYYKQNTDILALDSKYLLSAAYAIAGDRGKFSAMLPTSFSGEVAEKATGGSFYSDVRDEAIALNAILEVDPGNAQVGTMARHVSQELKTRKYLSTQERAFSFLALGKIARKANASNIKATVKVNGKQVGATDGSTLRLNSKQLGGSNVEISTTGTGSLYYFWQAEGITADGSFKEEDSYIKVRKRFYNRYGQPIINNTFEQNDLVIVAITLENSYDERIENIVITDMLPAGFEIENPRTKEIPGMSWIKNESYPEHLDVRDDRINLFTSLGGGSNTYYYAVRAVSPGTYQMGPVMADAMYKGEYHSYNGAGVVRITQK